MRFRQVLLGQLFQSFAAVHGHEDAAHQRDQRLIGADVRGRLLATDVLLAGGKRQHESALAVAIASLAHKASWHLAHKLVARSDYTAVRSAETKRHAEGLRLHTYDVGFSRRLHDAKRNRFGDRDDEQRALLVNDCARLSGILDSPEEVW